MVLPLILIAKGYIVPHDGATEFKEAADPMLGKASQYVAVKRS
jgi:hypothetical protein